MTPVLFGVLVSWGLTETFGWVFAGLVVPGYLAALFLLNPWGGLIDVVEAVVTYLVARLLGEYLPRTGLTSRIFGRERFFLIVLVSILVRLGIEGFLLPKLAPHATWTFSIGLVIVPLSANACWNTGLLRGLVQNGVPTLLVFLLLRWVVLPHTNLALEGFELATENAAASFLASPKAYILVITGAVLAAAANVRYGWDYSGILVPALLGLTVLEPVKLGATFAEAIAVLFAVKALLRFSPLGRANVEGPRRIVLFFATDYFLRFVFAWVMDRQAHGEDVVTLMGFGYLLPTLLAVKMSQRGSIAVVLFPTLKVSAAAFVLGTLIGFAAKEIDGERVAQAHEPSASDASWTPLPQDPAEAALWLSALALEGVPEPDRRSVPSAAELVKLAGDALEGSDQGGAKTAVEKLARGVIVLREKDASPARKGACAVMVKQGAADAERMVLLVPAPQRQHAVAALAARMLDEGYIDALVIAGVEDHAETNGSHLLPTPAESAARALAGRGTLVTVRAAAKGRADALGTRVTALAEHLHAKGVANSLGSDGEHQATLMVADADAARALAPAGTAAELTPSALAVRFEALRPSPKALPLDQVTLLRRLVLSPLLETGELDVARLAAPTLGYVLSAASPLSGGGSGVLLMPESAPRPIALVARTTGAHGLVVEAPRGTDKQVRDLALRLGFAQRADAMLIGLTDHLPMRGDAIRAAHATATSEGSDVLVVRKELDTGGAVTLAEWGDADGSLLGTTQQALLSLGVTAAAGPLDPALREMAGRVVFRESRLLAVTGDERALAASSLDGARAAARSFADTPLPLVDGAVAEHALALASELSRQAPAGPEDLAALGSRAALEQSVSARRAFFVLIASGTVRARLVRSPRGEVLVAVTHRDGEYEMVAAPADPNAAKGAALERVRAATLEKCAEALGRAGACRTGAR
jgi:hypothetical protein